MNCRSYPILFVLLIFIKLLSCDNPSGNKMQKENSPSLDPTNFWYNIVDVDSLVWEKEQTIDQEMSNYIYSLNNLDSTDIVKSINDVSTYLQKSANLYKFWDKLDHYVYHPNSPLRNDEVSLILFQELVKIPYVKQSYKIKYNRIIGLLAKNRIGFLANNFQFLDEKGNIRSLYEIESPYLILMLYDPNCNICNDVIYHLQNSILFTNTLKNEKVKLLAINVVDSEIKKSLNNHHENSWVNGVNRSQTIIKHELYNILAYPTIYILNEHKKVLYKDIDIKNVLQFVQSIS